MLYRRSCALTLLVLIATGRGHFASDEPAGPSSFTTTNVQEAGVDEPDLLKTNGEYVFYIADSTLYVTDAWPPPRSELAATAELEGRGDSMFLVGDRLIALTMVLQDSDAATFSATRITVLDMSDPARPRIESRFDLEGSFIGGRSVDGVVYLATIRYPRDGNPGDRGVLSVLGIDPSSLAVRQSEVLADVDLLARGWTVYGSRSSIYIAQDTRTWLRTGLRVAATRIHRFDLNGGSPVYEASGVVRGRILSQFSMSEHDGFLRVATTDRSSGTVEGTVEANNVFVLERNGSELSSVGELRGLAPEECLSAIRYAGDRGYLVTRKGIRDPFFTIDLSDSATPRVMGELHITGFSTYLHPFGDDHLVGLGRTGSDGDDLGRVGGLQVQMFDVSDPANPTLRHDARLPAAFSSRAERDHRALTFYSSHDLLAFPVALEARNERDGLSGILVYKVSPRDGFARLDGEPHITFWVRMADGLRRSAFIDDYIFAFSDVGMTVSHLGAVNDVVATVRFP